MFSYDVNDAQNIFDLRDIAKRRLELHQAQAAVGGNR